MLLHYGGIEMKITFGEKVCLSDIPISVYDAARAAGAKASIPRPKTDSVNETTRWTIFIFVLPLSKAPIISFSKGSGQYESFVRIRSATAKNCKTPTQPNHQLFLFWVAD